METAQSSDDSCDSEMRMMKNELIDFGLDEENLTKEEITDLLKALKNSKSTEKEEEIARDKSSQMFQTENNVSSSLPKKSMKRRYLNVRDRRLPWSLLPTTITPAEKARTLAIYIKLMSLNNYRQARQSANFAVWPPPIQIVEETTRVQPMRSTRSGRSVPVYDFDDEDSSDADLTTTKSKKRKVSNSDHNGTDGIYTNKVLSLKRKPPKEENNVRSVKEPKMDNKLEVVSIGNPVKPKVELFSLIED
ncbi:uncharacterized protein LOC113497381 isoform X1 [Trichoplusia ni]|uniref:Uncharacterized protein LOC113497381 isoform X1 n=1 Tax=Trichoplusia ni TaxID=7111 RepID=A0A7E5VWK4_TRINI|nr:uncharacterized protein LOC113497381 isoform X1 [Trichoplusia ni]